MLGQGMGHAVLRAVGLVAVDREAGPGLGGPEQRVGEPGVGVVQDAEPGLAPDPLEDRREGMDRDDRGRASGVQPPVDAARQGIAKGRIEPLHPRLAVRRREAGIAGNLVDFAYATRSRPR